MTDTSNENEFEGLGSSSSSPIGNEGGFDPSDTNAGSTSNEDRQPTPEEDILVHVTDKNAPIVLFFGAPSSGKTMTLVRLAKYLRDKKYKLMVDTNFCRTAWEYVENTKKFNGMLTTQYALKGTDRNDFLFIKVADERGTLICQLLEGAGENYFPSQPNSDGDRASLAFPGYMATVFGTSNKKVWAFITEPDWEVKPEDKVEYVSRIQFCKTQYSGEKDKFLVLYNKVDKSEFMINKDRVNEKAAMRSCNFEYPGIFTTFERDSLFGRSIDCKFVPFSTGKFDDEPSSTGKIKYTPSSDSHPARLWDAILKSIKG